MFLAEVETMYTELINSLTEDEKDWLQVFDKAGPYLPTKKIGKHNPREKEIRTDNEARQEWNRTVDEALVRGMPEEEVVNKKQSLVLEPVRDSIRREGRRPEKYRDLIRTAVSTLLGTIRTMTVRKEEIPQVDFRRFNEMIKVRKELYQITGSIDRIEKQIRRKQEKLDALQGLGGVFRLRLKKELMNEITGLLEERRLQQKLLDDTVTGSGYRNVASFLKAYEKAKKDVTEYKRYLKEHPELREEEKQWHKDSVLGKLDEYVKEGKKGREASKREEQAL